MAISIIQARREFTQVMIDVYKDLVRPTNFFRSFFEVKETAAKELSIEVQRGTEKIAVDVYRGSEGNRNTLSNSSFKVWVPPYFNEFIEHTSIRNYDVMFGENEGSVSANMMSQVVEDVAEDLATIRAKIERAYEVMAADIFDTGVVTVKSGENIDFLRKSTSKVDLGSGNYWDEANVDPYTSISAGCKHIREKALIQGTEFLMVVGETAIKALLNNDEFVKKANFRRVSLVDLSMPKYFSNVGATFHGVIAVDSYIIQIWTYPQSYVNASDTRVPYMNLKKMVLLPKEPRFKMGFAGVPQIVRDSKNAEFPQYIKQTKGAYSIGNYIDERAKSHIFDITSAGLPIPVQIDSIYTALVHS